MSTTVSTTAETAPVRIGRRWPWSVLRVVTVLTTLSAFTQAVLAGGVVAGRIEALPLHSTNGLLLGVGTLALLLALVLAWRPGGGPVWTPLAGLLLTVATVVQLGLGFSRSLAVHVPLGTTVIIAQVMLLVWVWHRPLPAQRS
ncbi:MAG TPA: hypothetical protein VIC62_11680 [Nakamurella sp.]